MLFCARLPDFSCRTHKHIQGSCCQNIRLFFEVIKLFNQIDRAHLIEWSSPWSGYRALSIRYRAFLIEYTALSMDYMDLVIEYKTLQPTIRVFNQNIKGLLSECRTL